jgi:replicative DNA helicase
MALKKLEAALNNRKKSGAGDLQIKEFGTGEASVSHIERYLELLYMYNEFVADFIVIDYGDIMKPVGKSTGDRYKDQGKVFQELRAFAKNHNVPVLTAAQTNRPPYGQRHAVITEERLADSYDKLRTLDGCYSINPKVIRGEDDDGEGMEIQTNEHYLWIIKNRNGIKDVEVPFLMKKDTMQIYDVEQ